jgi:glycosyltransferase involved in cell wall biosynthesis
MPDVVAIDARDGFAPELRGWGRYTRCLVEALRALSPSGIELLVLERGGRGPEMWFEQVRLPWALRSSGAALIHAPNVFLPLARRCPGVVTINDLAFEAWPTDFAASTLVKYRTLARLAARSAERIICPSSFTRDDICARYGVDPAKVRVIPDAPALLSGSKAPAAGPYLLAVGDLRLKKNLGALVGAFASLRRTAGIPHRLVLAGVDGGAGAQLRELAGDAPVEFAGYVGDGTLDALIRGAELLVYPSLHEGFGLVLLEAMARGTPVLAARATALPETGGDAVAYFDGSEVDLVAVLGSLLGDVARRDELTRRGLERVSQFSWERTARETVEVYRELL